MYKKKKILAIIPARGGSKRIIDKNIKLLINKPLIAHTIETSLSCKFIDRTIVSTDAKNISEIAKKYGAELINRPKNLAEDDSPTIGVVKHVLNSLKEKENYYADIIILLQPTSPLRTTEDIENIIKLMLDEGHESVVSSCEDNPYWSFVIKKNKIKPIFGWRLFSKKRKQDLPKAYKANGTKK